MSSRKGPSVPVEEAGLSPKGHNDIAASVEVVACDCHLGATRHWSSLRLQVREGQSLWRQREVLETQHRDLPSPVSAGEREAPPRINQGNSEVGHIWLIKEPGVTPDLSETLCLNARFGGMSSDPTPVCSHSSKMRSALVPIQKYSYKDRSMPGALWVTTSHLHCLSGTAQGSFCCHTPPALQDNSGSELV